MKYTLATNWDPALIDQIEADTVESVYGKLSQDIVGGGRASYLLKDTNELNISDYIRRVHEKGIEFFYLLNASCCGNHEFTRSWQREFNQFVEQLCDFGVDGVVVTIPYLVQIIKRRFPQLKISTSTFCMIDSIERAKYYEDMGVDDITVDLMQNRNFEFLEKLVNSVDCGITLYANHSCLFNCPFFIYHSNLGSHGSQMKHETNGFIIDFCYHSCTRYKYSSVDEIIRSRWIRPEDVGIYEAIGINKLKLSARERSTAWLLNTLNAYKNRRYDGNLLDILSGFDMGGEDSVNINIKYLLRPDFADIESIASSLKEKKPYIYLDNGKLDGFLEFYRQKNCASSDCSSCSYCKSIANKAITIDQEEQKSFLDKLNRNILEPVITGKVF